MSASTFNARFLPFLLVLFVLGTAGCGGTGLPGPLGSARPAEEQPPVDPIVSGTVYLWVGASKDALVSCGGLGCPEADNNYGLMGFLTVAGWQRATKAAYVYFDMPLLPPGAVVEEAYFEMYHGGQNEDGKTDDVQIPVARAAGLWSPRAITFANQPNKTAGLGETYINLNSQDWSGTPNIAGIIRDWMANPAANHGFVASWSPLKSPFIEKGFYSINDRSRTLTSMGLAPRLLLKVQLPDGFDSSNIFMPAFLPVGHDLPTTPGKAITMMRSAGGNSWPADWNVTLGF
jgi:hypothetical protein